MELLPHYSLQLYILPPKVKHPCQNQHLQTLLESSQSHSGPQRAQLTPGAQGPLLLLGVCPQARPLSHL